MSFGEEVEFIKKATRPSDRTQQSWQVPQQAFKSALLADVLCTKKAKMRHAAHAANSHTSVFLSSEKNPNEFERTRRSASILHLRSSKKSKSRISSPSSFGIVGK